MFSFQQISTVVVGEFRFSDCTADNDRYQVDVRLLAVTALL